MKPRKTGRNRSYRGTIRTVALALALVLAHAAMPAQAQSGPEAGETEDIEYEVIFKGIESAELREWLEKVSTLNREDEESALPFVGEFFSGVFGLLGETEENPLPLTVKSLRQKARQNLPELLKALHARGYYGASIRVNVNAAAEPVEIIYTVQPGARYRVASRQIALMPPTPRGITVPDITEIAPAPDEPAEAASLNDAAETLRKRIAEENCLLSVEVKPALRLQPDASAAHAYFEVTAGPKADFGALTITGNDTVRDEAIRRLIPWREGECFHATKIDQARNRLLKSGLFATSDIAYANTPDANGRVPVTVKVQERFHRTVKAGVSYMTDEGPGASAGWEHRNLFGEGEKLETRGVVSALQYSAEANYTEPYFLRADQSLKLGARIAREEPDAYTSSNTALTALVERELNEHWRAGAGAGYRLSRVEDVINGDETYGLVSLPVYAAHDSRDDILDPKNGIQARIDGTPYFDTLGSGSGFFKTLATGSTYFELPGAYSPVLAVRGALGSIGGASTRNIPADVRFYAGGGSSVRGYGYQELSPRMNGKPIGGKSLLETSAELRFRATETFGGALFVDGGNAFESEYPDFRENLRWGAGAGLRYYSDLGPLRLDVAFPLNRRESDSAFQLYVSLGQAF